MLLFLALGWQRGRPVSRPINLMIKDQKTSRAGDPVILDLDTQREDISRFRTKSEGYRPGRTWKKLSCNEAGLHKQ